MALFRRLFATRSSGPAEQLPPWRAEPEVVEGAIGYRFMDRQLLLAAMDRRAAAYGPLETLGDAINDLAVAVALQRAGRSLHEATALVTNVRLRKVYDAKLANTARFPDGDVVETIVGAVHLDAEFDAAAAVGVRLCTNLTWNPLPDRHLEPGAPFLGVPPFDNTERVIGSLVVQAALMDHWMRSSAPDWPSQQQLTERCAVHTSDRFFRSLGRRRTSRASDALTYRSAVKVGVARLLYQYGWSTASRVAVDLLLGP